MTDGAHRDWRLSARDQHLRTLARDPRGLRGGRTLAGAHQRAGAAGSLPRHEHLDCGVRRRGGAGGPPPPADHLGGDVAVVVRHRARLRAHRGANPGRAAGRPSLRRGVPLPARGDGGRAPPGRGRGAAAPGALARRQRHPGRRLARPPFQHDAGDVRERGRPRRVSHLPPHRHGRHGAADRPSPRGAARGLGGGAQGVPPDPVHHPDHLAVHDDRADAVRHGDAGRARRGRGGEPLRDPGLPGRGHPSLRPRGPRVRAYPGGGAAGGGRDRGRDRATRERFRGRALFARRRGAGRDRDRPERGPAGRHRGYSGQSRGGRRFGHHRDAAGARRQRRAAGCARHARRPRGGARRARRRGGFGHQHRPRRQVRHSGRCAVRGGVSRGAGRRRSRVGYRTDVRRRAHELGSDGVASHP